MVEIKQKAFVNGLSDTQIRDMCKSYCVQVCGFDDELTSGLSENGVISRNDDAVMIKYELPLAVPGHSYLFVAYLQDNLATIFSVCQIQSGCKWSDFDFSKSGNWNVGELHLRTMRKIVGPEYTSYIAGLMKKTIMTREQNCSDLSDVDLFERYIADSCSGKSSDEPEMEQ